MSEYSTVAKFKGGPLNNKLEEHRGHPERLQVRKYGRIDFRDVGNLDAVTWQDGEYVRSHETLKNGTVIYKWLGWYPNG